MLWLQAHISKKRVASVPPALQQEQAASLHALATRFDCLAIRFDCQRQSPARCWGSIDTPIGEISFKSFILTQAALLGAPQSNLWQKGRCSLKARTASAGLPLPK